jgi:hypothetical protein
LEAKSALREAETWRLDGPGSFGPEWHANASLGVSAAPAARPKTRTTV